MKSGDGFSQPAENATDETMRAASPWPNGSKFALFLSHDVDQVHDREIWNILADVNHIRRMLVSGEGGSVRLASQRVSRSLFRPKKPTADVETVLDIEARHGFRSTFFILHDRYWARNGARFHIDDPRIHAVADVIKAAGCEIGLHGGYYRFNNIEAYRESRQVLEEAFEIEVTGIRNHLLRFSGPETWHCQARAGFSYDATFGDQTSPGPCEGRSRPFWALNQTEPHEHGLVELPLTVMDGTLFRHRRLAGQDALDAAWESILPVAQDGGLVTLLWHQNYFNEREYYDWQWVYETLLDRLASMRPWCATGAEIDRWWRKCQSQAGER